MSSPVLAIIGHNSRIGPSILSALVSAPENYTIIVLLRATSSPPTPHPRLHPVVVPDNPTLTDLTQVLQSNSIDILVSALPPTLPAYQKLLGDACVNAGVKRYLAADYGSCLSSDPIVCDLLPNFGNKRAVRDHCIRLAEENPSFGWTSLVTGHFFDYGLETELLGVELEKKHVLLFDGGKDKWSASTTDQIGRAVVGVVKDVGGKESTRNRMVLVQSFVVTQVEVVDAVDKCLKELAREHDKDPSLTREVVSSKKFIKEKEAAIIANPKDGDAVEWMVACLGIKRTNWTGNADLANDQLGLEEESLDKVVRKVLGLDK